MDGWCHCHYWGNSYYSKRIVAFFFILVLFYAQKVCSNCPINNFWLSLISARRLSSSRPCATGRTSLAFSLWSERRTILTGSFSPVSGIVFTGECGIVFSGEWDRSYWWVGSSSLVSEIVLTGECGIVFAGECVVSTGEWDCHHWWVGSSSLVSGIVITGEWDH